MYDTNCISHCIILYLSIYTVFSLCFCVWNYNHLHSFIALLLIAELQQLGSADEDVPSAVQAEPGLYTLHNIIIF